MVSFTLPECAGGDTWSLLIDTNFEENNAKGLFKTGDTYDVTDRSVLLLALKSENAQKEQY
jgi:glycogen operon protein